MEKMKAEVTAFRPIFRLLCCRRGLRKKFRGLRPRNLTPIKLSRAVKNLPVSTGYQRTTCVCYVLVLRMSEHSSFRTWNQVLSNLLFLLLFKYSKYFIKK